MKHNKTLKNRKVKLNSKEKETIIVEKYMRKIAGVDTHLYKIKLNNYKCDKKVTLKKKPRSYINILKNNPNLYDFFSRKKLINTILVNNNNEITENLIKIIKPYGKFTYCLTDNALIISETKVARNKTKIRKFVRDLTSKHYLICDKGVCASGELMIKDNTFIFDNSSGTFKPTLENLQNLKKALPNLNMKLTIM
jgi:hypothetical protein